jgi:hypothetical protein
MPRPILVMPAHFVNKCCNDGEAFTFQAFKILDMLSAGQYDAAHLVFDLFFITTWKVSD